MAAAGTKNDKDWMIYREIRAIADRSGNPEVKGIADGVRQRLMAPAVRRDHYSPDERTHVGHDSLTPVTSPRVVRDRYRGFAEAGPTPPAHDAKTATDARYATHSMTRPLKPQVVEDKYRSYRR